MNFFYCNDTIHSFIHTDCCIFGSKSVSSFGSVYLCLSSMHCTSNIRDLDSVESSSSLPLLRHQSQFQQGSPNSGTLIQFTSYLPLFPSSISVKLLMEGRKEDICNMNKLHPLQISLPLNYFNF